MIRFVNRDSSLALRGRLLSLVMVCFFALGHASPLAAQLLSDLPPEDRMSRLLKPMPKTIDKEKTLIREIVEPELLLRLYPTQSRIIVTNYPITRTAISDPDIVDVQPFNADELEIVGKRIGEATLTFWFEEPGVGKRAIRYLVQVRNEEKQQKVLEDRIREFQSRINELFPNSQVMLFPVEDKLIVRGQVRDSQEAQQILQLLGYSSAGQGNGGRGNYRSSLEYSGGYGAGFGGGGSGIDRGGLNRGVFNGGMYGANPFPSGNPSPNTNDDFGNSSGSQFDLRAGLGINPGNIINQLKITGEQQVMLKVRVAELVRGSRRSAGADIRAVFEHFELSHLISGGGNATAILNDPDVSFFLRAIGNHSYGKILAEPTLITISGKPARFLAGGEFAVPNVVGLGGGTNTTFRGFGTQLSFTPTIMDKDLVRLEVSPSFSTLNPDAAVGGVPGLNLRSIDTTVDLREGQWLAIAGLIQDEQGGQRTRLPFLGDLPVIGNLFGSHDTSRTETELIVLVSPELVHPLEAEQVPLILPGMEITDPTDDDFFVRHQTEGYRGFDFRSTLHPERQAHLGGYKSDQISSQINSRAKRLMKLNKAYVSGTSGFSE